MTIHAAKLQAICELTISMGLSPASGLAMILTVGFFAFVQVTCIPIYKQAAAPINDRVADLLSQMTIQEKVAQTLSLWTQPVNNYDYIVDTYGNTSLGAVYGEPSL
jgi:hypothetical protein